MTNTSNEAPDHAAILRHMAIGGYGYFTQQEIKRLQKAADAITALRARVGELEGALDSIETTHGLTSNGNVWRFWAKQARESATLTKASRIRAETAEAALAASQEDAERLADTLEQIASTAESHQDFYDRNGPQWTSPHGNEYEDTSAVLTANNELAGIARAALAAHRALVAAQKDAAHDR